MFLFALQLYWTIVCAGYAGRKYDILNFIVRLNCFVLNDLNTSELWQSQKKLSAEYSSTLLPRSKTDQCCYKKVIIRFSTHMSNRIRLNFYHSFLISLCLDGKHRRTDKQGRTGYRGIFCFVLWLHCNLSMLPYYAWFVVLTRCFACVSDVACEQRSIAAEVGDKVIIKTYVGRLACAIARYVKLKLTRLHFQMLSEK